jgi:hypothetical protein
MQVDVSTSVLIDAARSVASAYASDPYDAPEWYVKIKKVEWRSPQPLRLGVTDRLRGSLHGPSLGLYLRNR